MVEANVRWAGRSVLGALALLLATVVAAPTASASYIYQDISVAGSLQTRATAINNSGQVVGYYQPQGQPLPGASANVGFILAGGFMSSLPITDPWGVNNLGEVVGYTLSNGVAHGQFLSNGVLTQLDVPGASATYLFGINDAGAIVGAYTTATGSQGFKYEAGVFTDLVVAGHNVSSAFRVDNGGNIFGVWDGVNQGFELAQDKSTSTLDYAFPGRTGMTYQWGRNALGQVVGFGSAGVSDRSYVYESGAFTALDYPGTVQTQAYSINDEGTIAGLWWDFARNQGHGFIATRSGESGGPGGSVPEPSSLMLILAALGALVVSKSHFSRRPAS